MQKLIQRRSLAGLVIGCIIALNINTSLSMEFGGMNEIFLPIGTLWNLVFIIGTVLFVWRTIDVFYWWLERQAGNIGNIRIET